MKRMSTIFRAKANKAFDNAEDPRETLDYSYERQREMLTKVRRGVADVATSRKRIELQRSSCRAVADKLDGQAKKALSIGREDLAREALTRKSGRQQDRSRISRSSTPTCRPRRRSSPSPRNGCRRRSSRSGRARRRSRRPTPPLRLRPGSMTRSPESLRRWVTSASPSSGPRTRPSRCRPAQARWTS